MDQADEGDLAAHDEDAGSREVALFGGSFNPPHMGHVYAASHVLATEPVDELWLMPAHTHAFGKGLAPFGARLDMCAHIARLFGQRAKASSVEGDLAQTGRPSFTVETLDYLRSIHASTRFALVIGSDNLSSLDRWKDSERIQRMARLIVINRSSHPMEGRGPAIPDVSSTWIRERIKLGLSVRGWVPRRVEEACVEGGWYR